jgi:protein-tyrosine-phosphatase
MTTEDDQNPSPKLDLEWLRARIQARLPTTILIVCLSNFIRSPFSEYILRRAIASLPPPKAKLVRITSGATVFDREKDGMHPLVRDYLVHLEGFTRAEVDAHVPKYVKRADNRHLLEEADVILAFEKTQLRTLPKVVRPKALLLSQFARGETAEIQDPFIDATPEVIARTFAQIKPYLEAILDTIKSV